MVKCSFCGEVIEQGTGSQYVKKDGKVFNFCSTKCEKSQLKLKRRALNLKWTKHYKKEGSKK